MHCLTVTVVHAEPNSKPEQALVRTYSVIAKDYFTADQEARELVKLIYAHFSHRCDQSTFITFHGSYRYQQKDNGSIYAFLHTLGQLRGFTVSITGFSVK